MGRRTGAARGTIVEVGAHGVDAGAMGLMRPTRERKAWSIQIYWKGE